MYCTSSEIGWHVPILAPTVATFNRYIHKPGTKSCRHYVLTHDYSGRIKYIL